MAVGLLKQLALEGLRSGKSSLGPIGPPCEPISVDSELRNAQNKAGVLEQSCSKPNSQIQELQDSQEKETNHSWSIEFEDEGSGWNSDLDGYGSEPYFFLNAERPFNRYEKAAWL